MKKIPAKNVKSVLHHLGLKPQRGNGTGHEIWGNSEGKRCNPVLRKKDVNQASIYALGSQLEGIGLCKRQAFMTAVRSA